MDALAAIRKPSGPKGKLRRKLQGINLHHITAEAEFPDLTQSSSLNLDWEFLLELPYAG